jgi:four helix bundle protein
MEMSFFAILNSMKENPLKEKSFAFALEIVRFSRRLAEEQREYVLSKQLLRSGTAIGALVWEAEHAQSRPDFIHKLSISLKEANETEYWIELLRQSEYLTENDFVPLRSKIGELNRLLIAIIKSSKGNR